MRPSHKKKDIILGPGSKKNEIISTGHKKDNMAGPEKDQQK